jgi:type I restriction enzyme S subunit
MSEWKEIEFSKILIDESISYGIVQPGAHTEINSIPIIRVNNIKNGYIQTEDVLKVEAAIEDKYKRTRLNGGELLITVVGSIGECAIVPENLKGWNVARAVSVAKIKREYDIRFIKYAFQTDDLIFQMYGNTNDTVQPTLNLSSLKALKFSIPPLTEQQSIASILSSLDDKIDLLHRQNATLEKMAETLFRQWFVERCPEPVEGEAKEGWEEVKITDLFEVRDGTHDSPKQKEFGRKLITSKHLSKHSIDFESAYFISEEDFDQINKRSKVDTGDILFSMIGTIGIIYLEQSNEIDYVIKNIGLFKTSQNPLWMYFTVLWLKSDFGNEFIYENRSGSTQEYISLGSLRSIHFSIPSLEKVEEFNKEIEPLFQKIKSNQIQIRTFAALRDTLLPKLMSGEVRVNN